MADYRDNSVASTQLRYAGGRLFAVTLFTLLVMIGLACAQPEPTLTFTPEPKTSPLASPTPAPAAATRVPAATPTPAPIPRAKFQVSSLVVTPEQLVAGSPATVEAQVANVGNASGTYRAILSVDGKEIDGKELSLSAGDKEEVSFSHLFQTPGSAELTIGAHSIKVNVVKPAQLQVLSLSVTPPLVFPGKQATVTAEVTNAGEAPGELLVSMEVDGVEADNRPLILLPGAIESVSFSVIKNTPGNYEVGIGNHSVSLTVPELETYRNEIFLYSVSYPSDWSLDDSLGPEVVSFRYPDEIGFIEIDTLIVPSGTGLDDQDDTWLPAIQANLPGFQVALRTPVEENGELVAYEFEGSYQNLRVFGAISGKGRWSWVRWTGIQEPFFETNKSLLRSVLSSFTPPVVTTATYVNLDEGFTLTLPPRWDGRETGGSPF